MSVKGQNYPHIEHLIIDGGSTDRTLDILARYGGDENGYHLTWLSEPDKGQADALNKGFQRANGEIIGWLNADDTYQSTAIESAVNYLQEDLSVDLVYGGFNFIDAKGSILTTRNTPVFSLEKYFYGDAIIPQTSMFFRRHILDEIGGVDPHLHYVMDWEFTFRIARMYKVKPVAEIWGNFRIVEHTKSVGQPENFWPEIIHVLQKVICEIARLRGCEAEEPNRLSPTLPSPDSPPFGLVPDRVDKGEGWTADALFMTHLLGSLEFARVGQLDLAQQYANQAFSRQPLPKNHAANLAVGLFRTACYPWHNAFCSHPLAQQTLDNLAICLHEISITHSGTSQRQILGYLYLYRAIKLIKQRDFAHSRSLLTKAKSLLSYHHLLDWQFTKMIFSAIIKP